jgi:hypothetical protein
MEGSLVAYKVFTNGSVLNASEINENLMNQSVMVFSNSTARAAALTSPVEGMLTWLEDANKYQNYNGSAWVDLGGGAILQVVSTTKTDTFTTSSSTFADITGLSATITPSSSASKIYVSVDLVSSQNTASTATHFRLVRNSTAIALGDAAGSRIRASSGSYAANAAENAPVGISFVDSPSTTSSTVYKVQIASVINGSQSTINRSNNDADSINSGRFVSTITLMEVAG